MNREVSARVLLVLALLSSGAAHSEEAFVISGPMTFYSDSVSGQMTDGAFEATVYYDPLVMAEVDAQPFGTTVLFRESVSRISWRVFDGNGTEVSSRDVAYDANTGSPRPDEGDTHNQQLRSGAQSVQWTLVHQPMNISYDRITVRFDDPAGGLFAVVGNYVDPLSLWGFAGTITLEAFDHQGAGGNQSGQGQILEISAVPVGIPDEDGDGVPDSVDACLGSDMSNTVIIEDKNSGVENDLLADGCTISDLVNGAIDPDESWKRSLADVTKLTHALKRDGFISRKDMENLLRTAAKVTKPKAKWHHRWSKHKMLQKLKHRKAICAKYIRGRG